MAAEATLEGMSELLAKLNQLGDKASKVENTALKAGAEIVQKAASELAKKSDLDKEHLADHIIISKVKTKNGVKYVEIGPTKGDNSRWFYGKFIEFGHLVKTKTGMKQVPAKPFMGPSYEHNKGKIIDEMKSEIKRGLGLQ